MPLLDPQEFDPASFNPSAGILARLIASGQMVPPPQPGPAPFGSLGAPPEQAAPPPAAVQPQEPPPAQAMGSAVLPPNATPTAGAVAAAPDTSLLGRVKDSLGKIGDAINAHPTTLMALGGGLAGAPSLGTGIGRGLTAAAPALNLDQKMQVQQQGIAATYKSLVSQLTAKGVPLTEAAQVAMSSVQNPEMMKATIAKYFDVKPLTPIHTTDMMGNQVPAGSFDPISGRYLDMNGKVISGPGGMSAGGGADYLAKDVKQVDPSLTGDAYLKQFSPEVVAAVNDYIGGRSMPTGNPRKGFTQTIKMIAQKYGSDIGVPADDASFSARRTLLNDLNKTTPGSIGGQITAHRTALNHLAEVADKAAKLGNWNKAGLPIAKLAEWANDIRGMGTEQEAKINGLNNATSHYGQEITKYYAGSPGGEGERQRFVTSLGGSKTSASLADALEAELELIPGRGGALESRIQSTLGPAASRYPVNTPETEAAINSVKASIAKLRSEAAPSSATPTLKPGQSTTIGGVTIKRVD